MFSEGLKAKIVEQCFDDVCEVAQKEDSGLLRGVKNYIVKPSILYCQEKGVVATRKKHELEVQHIYKLAKSNRRILIVKKLDEQFIFSIKLNGEEIIFECDQYACKCLN